MITIMMLINALGFTPRVQGLGFRVQGFGPGAQ